MADIVRLDNLCKELEATGRHEDAQAIKDVIEELQHLKLNQLSDDNIALEIRSAFDRASLLEGS